MGAIIVSSAAAGAGHGNYLAVMLLFPFSMLATGFLELSFPYLIALSAIQFPIYGILLGRENLKGRFGFAALMLLLFHGIGVALVLLFSERGSW